MCTHIIEKILFTKQNRTRGLNDPRLTSMVTINHFVHVGAYKRTSRFLALCVDLRQKEKKNKGQKFKKKKRGGL